MGIRFSCPHGHQLNVKSHLAGRKGRCPKCGVSVLIPNLPDSDSTAEIPKIIVSPEKSQAAKKKSRPAEEESVKEKLRVRENLQTLEKTDSREDSELFRSGKRLSSRELLADPDSVWYVQSPEGPQFGPATGAVIENWITQRRIAPNMLVWKDGWTNWIEARNAFPELAALFPESARISAPPGFAPPTENAVPEKLAIEDTPQFQRRREKKKKLTRNVLLILSFFLAILVFGVLLFVLTRSL